jgi:DNA-binding XRE family transcriptional regulator
MDTIEYRCVSGFPGYKVGSDGSVWGCLDNAGNLKTKFRRLKQTGQRNGYLRITLHRQGQRHFKLVHRLVLEVFVGACPPGMEACHSPNPDKTDNRLSNLRWDTKSANAGDRVTHGTQATGGNHPNAKLTDQQVQTIRERYAAGGVTYEELAMEFGVNSANIGHIVSGRAWQHLPTVDCDRSSSGARNGQSKLTDDQVKEIRRLYATGAWKQAQLASTFGVTHQTVSRICRGELWKHVEVA